MAMHQHQLKIDASTVSDLVAAQFPSWRDLRVEPLTTAGTVNAIFRLGPDLAARFPLVPQDPATTLSAVEAEAEAAREFATVSPFPSPRPVAVGRPGNGYPLPWSVQTWLHGHDATVEDPASSEGFAADLASLVLGLRGADTHGRSFDGAGRGGHLPDHDGWVEVCFRESEQLLDVPTLQAIWAELRELPVVDADAMCHGDLTPPNLLVEGGRLAGVLDVGSFGPADPALDLVACWHLLDDAGRRLVRQALGPSDTQWLRGMAWAFEQSMGLVWYYRASNPSMARWGRRTLERIARTARESKEL